MLFFLIFLSSSKGIARKLKKHSKEIGDAKCMVCKTVVKLTKNYIMSPVKKVQSISEFVSPICSCFKGDTKEVCKDITKKHIPEITRLIKKNIAPTNICRQIKLCPCPKSSPQENGNNNNFEDAEDNEN